MAEGTNGPHHPQKIAACADRDADVGSTFARAGLHGVLLPSGQPRNWPNATVRVAAPDRAKTAHRSADAPLPALGRLHLPDHRLARRSLSGVWPSCSRRVRSADCALTIRSPQASSRGEGRTGRTRRRICGQCRQNSMAQSPARTERRCLRRPDRDGQSHSRSDRLPVQPRTGPLCPAAIGKPDGVTAGAQH